MTAEIHIIRPQGRLDSSTSPHFEEEMLGAIGAGAQKLLIDFSELNYISSAGLRVILLASKRVKANFGRLALCCISRQISEVFDISGFSKIFDIQPTHEAGIVRLNE
jgi:anti-anti-sigma factor